MNFVNTSSPAILLPACAQLAAVCAAIEGREVTCPTLAAIRRMTIPVSALPAQ